MKYLLLGMITLFSYSCAHDQQREEDRVQQEEETRTGSTEENIGANNTVY